eukprot:3576415-Rhodomonas_salina.1
MSPPRSPRFKLSALFSTPHRTPNLSNANPTCSRVCTAPRTLSVPRCAGTRPCHVTSTRHRRKLHVSKARDRSAERAAGTRKDLVSEPVGEDLAVLEHEAAARHAIEHRESPDARSRAVCVPVAATAARVSESTGAILGTRY